MIFTVGVSTMSKFYSPVEPIRKGYKRIKEHFIFISDENSMRIVNSFLIRFPEATENWGLIKSLFVIFPHGKMLQIELEESVFIHKGESLNLQENEVNIIMN